jgi:hypothetical protein
MIERVAFNLFPMTTAIRSSAKTVPAPRDLERDAAKDRHLKVTGEVVWEWNALHRTFGYVFMTLLGDHQSHVSNALWLTPTSDKAQRDLLKTALEWADGVRAPHRERLIWALDQADKLSTYRNDIVHGHAGFLISKDGLNVHLSSGQNSFKRVLKHQRIDTSFHEPMAALCEDLRRLEHFVAEVWRRMRPSEGPKPPSPRRPTIRSLTLVDAGHKRTHVAPACAKSKPKKKRAKSGANPR